MMGVRTVLGTQELGTTQFALFLFSASHLPSKRKDTHSPEFSEDCIG